MSVAQGRSMKYGVCLRLRFLENMHYSDIKMQQNIRGKWRTFRQFPVYDFTECLDTVRICMHGGSSCRQVYRREGMGEIYYPNLNSM